MLIDTQRISDARVCSAQRILAELYNLVDAGSVTPSQIQRIERETIFFLLEGGDAKKWDAGRPHSIAARQSCRRSELTYDHAIPLAMLKTGLRVAAVCPIRMNEFAQNWIQGVVITREEDSRLTAAGLRNTLPTGANPGDKLARYRAVDIMFAADDEKKLERASK